MLNFIWFSIRVPVKGNTSPGDLQLDSEKKSINIILIASVVFMQTIPKLDYLIYKLGALQLFPS